MNDAWNVIGWTAQKAPVIFPDSVNPPWLIPADIDTIRVQGEYHSMDGGRPTGYVEFKPSTSLTHASSLVSLMTPTFIGRIGMDGRFSLTLPATDSLGLVEKDWTYDVTVVLLRKVVRRFTCGLPAGPPVVDINSLTTVAVSTPIPSSVTVLDSGEAMASALPILDGGKAMTGDLIQTFDGGTA